MEFSKKYFGAVMSVLLLEGRTAQLSTYESNLLFYRLHSACSFLDAIYRLSEHWQKAVPVNMFYCSNMFAINRSNKQNVFASHHRDPYQHKRNKEK